MVLNTYIYPPSASLEGMARLRTNAIIAAVTVGALLATATFLAVTRAPPPSPSTLRLGYFPNITHAQAVFGVATGLYQQYLGEDIQLETRTFNAGPTAIESLLSNQVDVTFVGPGPTAVSGLAHTDILRVIAGGASGGALFVVQPDLTLAADGDYSDKKFASPQAGNTQDVALKHYLFTKHHVTLDRGGDVEVINAANPDILALFRRHQIDGAWVPEPWATRLALEGNGKVQVDERSLWPPRGDFVTTHLVTTKAYLEAHRDVVKRLLEAHLDVTQRLQNPQPATLRIINDAITNLTGSRLGNATIAEAFHDLNITYDPIRSSMETYLQWSKDLGFVPQGVKADLLYDLSVLNEVLLARGLPRVA